MATERELSEEALKAIADGVTAKLRETLPELTASTAGRRSGGEPGASDETPAGDDGDSRTPLDTAEPLRGEE